MSRSRVTAHTGLTIGLGVVVLAAVAIIVTRVALDDAGSAQSAGPVPTLPSVARAQTDQNATSTEPTTDTKLGVFEKLRGWIVYPIGDRLEAVNPADPSGRHVIELPEGLMVLLRGDGANPMPAGWSADGTRLALTDEYHGDAFVMNADGSMTRVNAGHSGCCLFVPEPWLSPDATIGLMGVSREGIRYADVSGVHSDTRELDPPLPDGRDGWVSAWSGDGSRIAFVTVAEASGAEPTLHVGDFSTGANHVLARLAAGHVRHIVWSPDDTQVLVVAGGPLEINLLMNPLVSVQPTKLLLVETDGSGVREIASGYYVATSWSPDGTQIAAIQYGAERTLVVMNADGTGEEVLRKLPTGDLFTGVAWHPLPDQG